MRALVLSVLLVLASSSVNAQEPLKPGPAEGPNIKVLTGMLVPEFVLEMQHFVQALGVSCQYCHVRNDFANEGNDRKLVSRQMIEMTKAINKQYFPNYTPLEGESRLGRVTCMTCHQGEAKPKTQ
jgi:Photosynthetic reaction centre cytochrome C subunit